MIQATIHIPSLRHKLAAAIHTLATMPAMLALLALPLALTTSCATDELVSPVTPTPGQQVTITASLGGGDHATPNTRMDYTPNTDATIGGLITTWTEGDAFNIVPMYSTAVETFTLVAGAGTSTGTFEGTAPDDKGEGYIILHPSTIKSTKEFLNFSYTGQTQKGNNNLTHLTAYHSMELLTKDYTTIDFSKPLCQSSCMKFVLTLPEAIIPKKITLDSADGSTCFFTNNGIYVKESANPDASSLSLLLDNFDATNTITAYMMMAYLDVTLPAAGITVTVVAADGSNYTQTIVPASNKLSLAGGKMHTITASNMAKPVAKMTFKVKVDNTNGFGFKIPFEPNKPAPADMTVTWGDGSNPVKITKGDTYNISISHTYDAASEYTITITSTQIDATQKQMPTFNFYQYGKDNNSATKLTSMDSPMLNTGSSDFELCFQGCTALTTIHAGLFENNTQIEDFSGCFKECTALTEIPAGLFEKNTAAENFSYCFYECKSLTAIPPGLFENNTAAENFQSCFNSCSKLKLNAKIFSTAAAQNNTRFKDKTVDFSYCFYNVGGKLTDAEVQNSIAPELWLYDKGTTGTWTTTLCFGKYENSDNSGKFSNSGDIFVGWGGTKPDLE